MSTLTYTVEVAFGSSPFALTPTWTDITAYVLGGSTGQIQITRGRLDEFSDVQPGRLVCTLDNSDGRFTPGLASSPYHPNVKIRKRIRVTARMLMSVNMVDNPSFESGPQGWEAIGAGPPALAVSSTQAHSGVQSLRLTWQTHTGSLNGAAAWVFGFTPGTTYTASAYVYVPTGSPDVAVVVSGAGVGTATSTKDAFVRITHTWVATTTSYFLGVVASGNQDSGDLCYLDAVQVEQGATATTFGSATPQVFRRFDGHVTSYPNLWPSGTTANFVTLTAIDRLQPIRRNGALSSFLTEEVLLDQPTAYAPLSDPDGATNVGNLAGNGLAVGSITNIGGGGTYTLGQGTGPAADGSTALVLTPASATSGYYVNIPMTYANFSGSYGYTLEAWVLSTINDRTFLSLLGTNLVANAVGFNSTEG